MAWRVNALKLAPMAQLAMNWGLSIGSLIIVLPTVWTVTQTTIIDGTDLGERVDKEVAEE
jgi:hypothetical protein